MPPLGSCVPTAAWAFANAVGKSAATPITSPVERISGPSSASAPAKRSNGSTASLTETWLPHGSSGRPMRRELLAEHHAAGELGQRQAGGLGDERDRPRGARVGLDDVQVVAVDAVLDVDQADHAEREREVARGLADLVQHLGAERVRRQHAGRVAGVDAGLLDVLHDAADPDVLAVADRVDVDLDRVLEEAVEEDLALRLACARSSRRASPRRRRAPSRARRARSSGARAAGSRRSGRPRAPPRACWRARTAAP